jgi:hypothetical protein
MADIPPYVDVLALAVVQRTIETYRAKIEPTVHTRRKQSCLEESLKLREQVIAALIDSGIDFQSIEEAGGESTHPIWSWSKHVRHELHIRHDDMLMLIRAMGAVERLFLSIKEPYFSGIKREFTFHVPTPEFAKVDDAGEEALKAALTKARAKAAALAQEAGCELGPLVSIIELPRHPVPSRKPNYDDDSVDAMFDAATVFPDHDYGGGGPGYTAAQPPQGVGRTFFRVRFALTRSS